MLATETVIFSNQLVSTYVMPDASHDQYLQQGFCPRVYGMKYLWLLGPKNAPGIQNDRDRSKHSEQHGCKELSVIITRPSAHQTHAQ